MNFFRSLLSVLAWAIFLALMLAAFAFVPLVQTQVAEAVLDTRPGLQGSLGSFYAAFGRVRVEDLQLKRGGIELTLPSLQARMPLLLGALERKAAVRSLVAKGWTLDLSRAPRRMSLSAAAFPARAAAAVFGGLLGQWRAPCALSLDGVDLEGDVVVGPSSDSGSNRLHVVIRGGGLAAGREGSFMIAATGDVMGPNLQSYTAVATGRVAAAMDAARVVRPTELKADFSTRQGTLPADLTLSVAASRAAGGLTGALALNRGSRHLVSAAAAWNEASRKAAGTWKVDLQAADLAYLEPDQPLAAAVAGEGTFEAGADGGQVRARGRLVATSDRPGTLMPAWSGLGPVSLEARFDLAHAGTSDRFQQLRLVLAGARLSAEAHSLQTFVFDEKTRLAAPDDPSRDWLEGSIRRFPLSALSGVAGPFAPKEGDLAGSFLVRAEPGGFALRSKGPLTAAGVTLARGAGAPGPGFDLSLGLAAEYAATGWEVSGSPLIVSRAGRRLATLQGKASRGEGPDAPLVVSGRGSLALPAFVGRPPLAARSVSGSFSATLGTAAQVNASVSLVGSDPTHSLSVSLEADAAGDGTGDFDGPVRIAFGPSVSALSAEGTWSRGEAGPEVEVKLSGGNVALDHLRWLAAWLAAAGGAFRPAAAEGGAATPFWGNWTGGLTVDFDRVTAGDRGFKSVNGTIDFDPSALRLLRGEANLPGQGMVRFEGGVAFDPAAKTPYRLNATANLDGVEVGPFFKVPNRKEPLVEGRFSFVASLAGEGRDPKELLARTGEQFQLTSKVGIVRFLSADVADAMPNVDTTSFHDTMGSVGSAVGWVFGFKRPDTDTVRLDPNTEAVLEFTNEIAEIGYDQIAAAASLDPDGAFRLLDLELIAPGMHVTGSGRIGPVKGGAFRAAPLDLEFQLGARGRIADLLATAGLLSGQKDDLGYALLRQPIRLKGTLEHLDNRPWIALLAKAAAPKPKKEKKAASE